MRKILILAALLPLVGCNQTSGGPTTSAPVTQPSQYSAIVAKVQADWPLAEIAINLILSEAQVQPPVVAIVSKIEEAITAAVSSLSPTTAPTTLPKILAYAESIVNALPATRVSDPHKTLLDEFITWLQTQIPPATTG